MFQRTTSCTSTGRALLVAAGVCASIAIGALGTSGGAADARVKTGAKGSLASMCRAYESDYDRTMAAIEQAKKDGDWAKVQELRTLLGHIWDAWDDECAGTYGSIAYLVVSPAANDGSAALQPVSAADGGGTSAKTAMGAWRMTTVRQ